MPQDISRVQCRAARALLDWSQAELAEAAKVARQTVVDFERGARTPLHNNLEAMRRALEAAGVSFLGDDDGEGVKLSRRRKRSKR